MTKTSFIIAMLKLSEKLDNEHGLGAIEVIGEMEDLCDDFLNLNKQ